MAQALGTNIRASFRYALRDALEDAISDRTATLSELAPDLELGLAELEVITRGNLRAAIAAVFDEPLPPTDVKTAEVAASHEAAFISVWAYCPRCGLPATIPLSVSPQLVVDTTSAELKLKAKSKGRIHVCGQLPIQVAPDPDGQLEAFETEPLESEGTGEPMEGIGK